MNREAREIGKHLVHHSRVGVVSVPCFPGKAISTLVDLIALRLNSP